MPIIEEEIFATEAAAVYLAAVVDAGFRTAITLFWEIGPKISSALVKRSTWEPKRSVNTRECESSFIYVSMEKSQKEKNSKLFLVVKVEHSPKSVEKV